MIDHILDKFNDRKCVFCGHTRDEHRITDLDDELTDCLVEDCMCDNFTYGVWKIKG